MGVSIDIYRQRIGCFTSTRFKVKSSPDKTYHKENGLICFSLTLRFILLFTLFIQCEHLEQSSSFKTNRSSAQPCPKSKLFYPIDVNFDARYKFGNKKKGGIKIMHWNAGGGYLKNKIHEIENVIAGYKPHLLSISETSFKKGQDISDIQIQDYKIYFSKTLDNPRLKVSRCCVYVHKDIIKPKLRLDLMSDEFSSVWLELNLPRQKRILVGNAYRDCI